MGVLGMTRPAVSPLKALSSRACSEEVEGPQRAISYSRRTLSPDTATSPLTSFLGMTGVGRSSETWAWIDLPRHPAGDARPLSVPAPEISSGRCIGGNVVS